MATETLTDEIVEQQIVQLKESPMVKLALMYEQVRTRRRQYLLELKQLEKKGNSLVAAGITISALQRMAGENNFAE